MGIPAIGRSIPRREGRAKVTGQARYIDDLTLPGMLHGVTVRSPVPRGVIREIRYGTGIPWDEITVVTALGTDPAAAIVRNALRMGGIGHDLTTLDGTTPVQRIALDGDGARRFVLHTGIDPRFVDFGGVVIELVALSPEPVDDPLADPAHALRTRHRDPADRGVPGDPRAGGTHAGPAELRRRGGDGAGPDAGGFRPTRPRHGGSPGAARMDGRAARQPRPRGCGRHVLPRHRLGGLADPLQRRGPLPAGGDAATPVAVAAAETAEASTYRSSIAIEYAQEQEFQPPVSYGFLTLETSRAPLTSTCFAPEGSSPSSAGSTPGPIQKTSGTG